MEVQNFIDEYLKWLRSEMTASQVGEYCEITAPFLDMNNDYIQFYVKRDGSNVFFTDDGFTVTHLETAGFQLTRDHINKLSNIVKLYKVQLRNKRELCLTAPASEFAASKHAFIQCLIHVTDLYMTVKPKMDSYFLDDIQNFFSQQEIYCMENVQFTGKSGYTHRYDFAMQRSKKKPERLLVAINNPDKTAMQNTLFAWEDTRPERKSDSRLIVMLNDENHISSGIEAGFANYDVDTIRWSDRLSKEKLSLLSA